MAERWEEIRDEIMATAPVHELYPERPWDEFEVACKRIAALEADCNRSEQGSEDLARLVSTLEAELAQHQWIPVGERLPVEGEDVMVWRVMAGSGWLDYGSQDSDDDETVWWSQDGDEMSGTVTHWRPLPKGPSDG